VVGKPPQVEVYGKLKPYPDDSPAAVLTPNKVEEMAVYLMNGIERLERDFLTQGRAIALTESRDSPGSA